MVELVRKCTKQYLRQILLRDRPNPNNVHITADPPTHPYIRTIATQIFRTPMDSHLSIKFIPNGKFTNGEIINRKKKQKMRKRCDEIRTVHVL